MGFYQQHLMGMKDNPTILIQKKQLSRYFYLLTRPKKNQISVLDLGCGDGEVTLKLLLESGIFTNSTLKVTGVDISQKALSVFTARTGFEAISSEVTNLPIPDSSVDLVVLDDVLEHLEDTDKCMQEINRVLRGDGLLLLSTPNLAAWFNRILLLLGAQPIFSEVSFLKVFGRPGKDIVGHLRLFTTRALVEFLEFHGFEIVSHKMSTFQPVPKLLHPLDAFFSLSKSLGANNVILCRKNGSKDA